MGFFDEASQLLGGGGAGDLTSLAQQLVSQHGGIQGLLDTLSQGGLSQHVASWVGNGQNLPVSMEEIQQVLGNEQVQALAGKLGIDPQQALSMISQHLPGIIDKLTPGGQVPQGGADLLAQGESLLKGFFS
jgi:uncharacterized protein YidB (DUF937 family)